jgi:hypothetical protein
VSPNHPAGAIVADDGIRLLQAYNLTAGTDASGNPDGSELALAHEVPASRFAENENLYRLSKGHGGLMCQACHGTSGDGTVLSRMATDRMLWCKDEKGLMCDSEGWTLFPAGHEVGCADCHTKML